MRDVARLAGVSQSTVSRVVSQANTPIAISDETTRKVLDAVQKLGYRPNLAARSLRGLSTRMIAVMIADISNPMYHSIVRTTQAIARHRDYDVLICNTDHVYENELHFCEAIMRRPVDGAIMVPYQLTKADMQLLTERAGLPVAALSWPGFYDNVDTVYADDDKATYSMVKWLIEVKQHRRLAFIRVSHAFPPGERRLLAFARALTDAGLPLQPEYVHEGDFTLESGQRVMRALLELPEPPTAVVACNDLMAIGAIDAAHDLNFRVPEDVAIVGFDNIPETTIIRPRLTTIEQNPIQIGELLAQALFERIEGVVVDEGRNYEVACRFIERQST